MGLTTSFPTVISDGYDELLLYDVEVNKKIELRYQLKDSDTLFAFEPWQVEKLFKFDRMKPKGEIVRQNKYDCAAAALAMLLGHTLFNVSRVMGSHGWCNDARGATNDILIPTARDFGRDLIFVGSKTIGSFGDDLPDCELTVTSLNYDGFHHGVAWVNKEILDPNFGHPTRKYWHAGWSPWTMGAKSALVLAKRPLTEGENKELKGIRKHGTVKDIKDFVKEMI